MRDTIEQRLGAMQEESGKKIDQMRLEATAGAEKIGEGVTEALKTFSEMVGRTLTEMGSSQRTQFGHVTEQLLRTTDATEKKLEAQRTAIDERLQLIQADAANNSKHLREEVISSLAAFNDSVLKGMTGMGETQQKQMGLFSTQIGKLADSKNRSSRRSGQPSSRSSRTSRRTTPDSWIRCVRPSTKSSRVLSKASWRVVQTGQRTAGGSL